MKIKPRPEHEDSSSPNTITPFFVQYSIQIFALLLLVGLSLVINGASAQTYASPVTVNVNYAGVTAGIPGYISVDDQQVDNATHVVTSIPGYSSTTINGWITVGSADIYYGINNGNAYYKEGMGGSWELIFNSNSLNVAIMSAINVDNTIANVKWYMDDGGSDIHEIQGQFGTASEVISGGVNDMTSNGSDTLYITRGGTDKVRAYAIN